jgi:hypothetical protein
MSIYFTLFVFIERWSNISYSAADWNSFQRILLIYIQLWNIFIIFDSKHHIFYSFAWEINRFWSVYFSCKSIEAFTSKQLNYSLWWITDIYFYKSNENYDFNYLWRGECVDLAFFLLYYCAIVKILVIVNCYLWKVFEASCGDFGLICWGRSLVRLRGVNGK